MSEKESEKYGSDLKKAKKSPPLEQRGQILRREPLKEIKKAPPPERRKTKSKEGSAQ